VAVEKLAHHDFAEIASRQEALQTIFPSLLDIFYYPIVDFFEKNRVFQHSESLWQFPMAGPGRLKPFDSEGDRVAAAQAECGDPAFEVAALQLIQQRDQDAGA
jgi:hypothetical protein